MFNIVDYFIDYKYLEDNLNLNVMKYLWEQDLIHYVLTSFVWIIDYLIVKFERYFKEFEYIPIIKYGWNMIVYFTDK